MNPNLNYQIYRSIFFFFLLLFPQNVVLFCVVWHVFLYPLGVGCSLVAPLGVPLLLGARTHTHTHAPCPRVCIIRRRGLRARCAFTKPRYVMKSVNALSGTTFQLYISSTLCMCLCVTRRTHARVCAASSLASRTSLSSLLCTTL